MHKIFLSYAEEDGELALRLAGALERAGFSCWYYQRDTLPGCSYLIQIADAIECSKAVLLLISSDSVGSHQITREIACAHELDRPFVPLLVDLTLHQFHQLQPEWRAALGTTAAIDLRSGDFNSIVQRLIKGLQLLHIEADSPSQTTSPARTREVTEERDARKRVSKLWASDANQIDIALLDEVVFRTELIEDFLQGHRYFISANKGLGKTLLLTYKRSKLYDQYREGKEASWHASVHFVPEGRPYLDLMSDIKSLSKPHKNFLSELVNCKRMWSLALKISAISHFPGLITDDALEEFVRLPKIIPRWLQGSKVEPTVVFKELLASSIRDINRLVDANENVVEFYVRSIQSGIFIFIDKVDQAIRDLPRQAWINVQAGLVEAAWDLMNSNSHIKVFATIREEAFANYVSDIKNNLYGSTTILRYNDKELGELLDKLTSFYEHEASFQDFIHMNVVRNAYSDLPEDSFQYLHRHTLGRPRDLAIICSELSKRRRQMTETLYRDIVNDVSSDMLVSNVFDEMKVFLDSLRLKSERQRLFSMLPYNILTHDELIDICCRFNEIDRQTYEAIDHTDLVHHPFCELYYCGLLGTLTREAIRNEVVQKFKQPHDLINEFDTQLPPSELYLLHPSLHALITKFRGRTPYHVFKFVIVGHNYPWLPHFRQILAVQKQLFALKRPDLVVEVEDLLREINYAFSESGVRNPKSPERCEQLFETLKPKLEQSGYEELYLHIEELMEARPAAKKP